ncbi:MAG: prokaryotic n-terminal methylation site [Verrucomicrobiaceae bacterium]|nr:prokaryotic n-terminal methylation site [Verrucomicrobiaceae bacterium]MDB6116755.1 prokaryotic n-terminal methylation site [Verrucomicrobiaceae bacterium]
MKTRFTVTSRRAFTLIELLVVITIISMLASLVSTAVMKVMDNAQRVRAHAALSDIVMAVNNYHTEYNRYPVPAADNSEEPVRLSAGNTMLKILLGGNDNKMNPKGSTYLQPPMAKNGAGGLSGSDGSQALNDPWGGAYEVAVDANFDNRISNPDKENEDPSISQNVPSNLVFGVIASSYGRDGKKGTKDDVVSWRQ